MKAIIRYLGTVLVALVLAIGLGAGTELPNSRVAEAQLGVNWDIGVTDTSFTSLGPSGPTQNTSSDSHRTSDDGETEDDHQSSQKNEDGSGSEQENFTHDDAQCRKSGGYSRHTTIDKNGNRTVHTQTVWYENGKCEIVVTDAKFDKNNNPIGKPETKKYPCAQYKLEMAFKGTAFAGFATMEWGPHKAVIPLTDDNGTLRGSYEGQFNGVMTGECNGYAIYPVSVQVTAVEDEFEDLEFTVELAMSMQFSASCPDVSASNSMSFPKGTKTFTLPAQDGASYVMGTPGGELAYTFTLRKQCGGK